MSEKAFDKKIIIIITIGFIISAVISVFSAIFNLGNIESQFMDNIKIIPSAFYIIGIVMVAFKSNMSVIGTTIFIIIINSLIGLFAYIGLFALLLIMIAFIFFPDLLWLIILFL